MYLGVRMVIALSIERIHRANLINFGIIPAIFADEKDYTASVNAGDRLVIENVREAIGQESRLRVQNTTTGAKFDAKIELSARERRIVLAGGLINATTSVR
jgi:aconitate hydratase